MVKIHIWTNLLHSFCYRIHSNLNSNPYFIAFPCAFLFITFSFFFRSSLQSHKLSSPIAFLHIPNIAKSCVPQIIYIFLHIHEPPPWVLLYNCHERRNMRLLSRWPAGNPSFWYNQRRRRLVQALLHLLVGSTQKVSFRLV